MVSHSKAGGFNLSEFIPKPLDGDAGALVGVSTLVGSDEKFKVEAAKFFESAKKKYGDEAPAKLAEVLDTAVKDKKIDPKLAEIYKEAIKKADKDSNKFANDLLLHRDQLTALAPKGFANGADPMLAILVMFAKLLDPHGKLGLKNLFNPQAGHKPEAPVLQSDRVSFAKASASSEAGVMRETSYAIAHQKLDTNPSYVELSKQMTHIQIALSAPDENKEALSNKLSELRDKINPLVHAAYDSAEAEVEGLFGKKLRAASREPSSGQALKTLDGRLGTDVLAEERVKDSVAFEKVFGSLGINPEIRVPGGFSGPSLAVAPAAQLKPEEFAASKADNRTVLNRVEHGMAAANEPTLVIGTQASAFTAIVPPTGPMDFNLGNSGILTGGVFGAAANPPEFTLVDGKLGIVAPDAPMVDRAANDSKFALSA